jgi:hypothetical protein
VPHLPITQENYNCYATQPFQPSHKIDIERKSFPATIQSEGGKAKQSVV